MTRVSIEHDGDRYRLSARGHAAGSVEGCAFISGILYSLAGYLANEEEILLDKRRMEPGDVELRFRGGTRAEAAYEMAVIGLKQLERSFPDVIQVTERAGTARA